MSEWELYDPEKHGPLPEEKSAIPSEWSVIEQKPQESFGRALAMAPGRIGEDLSTALLNAWRGIPGAYESAKTEIPGLAHVLMEHPGHAAKQAAAGLTEMGHNVLNMPHGISEYLSNRLNLIPESITQSIPHQQDISQQINQAFGQPEYPGENLLRGITRNIPNIGATTGAASLLNPLRYTAKGISKNVVKELNNQVSKYNKKYDSLWDKAAKTGFDKVHYDPNLINQDLQLIKKSYSPKQYKNIEEFTANHTLQNAQAAQSDLGSLRRALEEKSKKGPLIGEEKDILDSLSKTEKHIEQSMFKNAAGQKNEKLANQYHKVSKGYKKDVVPYKYNPDIQKYLNEDITAPELVQALSRGPFAAKKGYKHPAFAVRKAILPTAVGIGALGGGLSLIDFLLNRNNKNQNFNTRE